VHPVFNVDLELRLAADAMPERYRSFFVTPSCRGNLLGQRRGPAAGQFPRRVWDVSAKARKLIYGGPNPNSNNTTGVAQTVWGGREFWHSFSLRCEFPDFSSRTPTRASTLAKPVSTISTSAVG
jgi:hypothetical protein